MSNIETKGILKASNVLLGDIDLVDKLNELSTSSGVEGLNNVINNTTLISGPNGSFFAGEGAGYKDGTTDIPEVGPIAIGQNSKVTHSAKLAPIAIGANSDSGIGAVAIGTDANAGSASISIGRDSTSAVGSIAIGSASKSPHSGSVAIGGSSLAGAFGMSLGMGAKAGENPDGATPYLSNIQLLQGTNNKANTLQIKDDNIYDYKNHKLTVQNIELNGADVNNLFFSLDNAESIPENADLNDYKESGNYGTKTYGVVATLKNKPSAITGIFTMRVYSSNGSLSGQYPIQEITTFDRQIFLRRYNNDDNAWSEWREVLTNDGAQNLTNKIFKNMTRFEGIRVGDANTSTPSINMAVRGSYPISFGGAPSSYPEQTIFVGTCDRTTGEWTDKGTANLAVENEIYFKGNIALSEEIRNHYVVDTTGLDENKYYLVTLKINAKRSRIEIFNYFNGGTPSWGTHDSKNWACCYSWEVTGGGYGIAYPYRIIQVANSRWANDHPCLNIGQMENSSNEYVYVRGGAKYNFYTTGNVVPELHTSDFSASSQTMPSPRTADQLSKIVPFFTDSANSINVKSLKTWSDAGYETDIYGNFKHRRKNDNDTFEIDSYDGEKSVTVKMESGNTTIAGGVTIKGYKQPNASSTANIHVISTPEFDELGVEPDTFTYLQALLKWICRTYPQYKYGLFVGQCSPNSTGSFQVQIYENNVTINGLPEYSSGFYVGLSNQLCLFGTTAGNFNFREV